MKTFFAPSRSAPGASFEVMDKELADPVGDGSGDERSGEDGAYHIDARRVGDPLGMGSSEGGSDDRLDLLVREFDAVELAQVV